MAISYSKITQGRTWTVGTGTPASNGLTGSNGDRYVDTTSGIVWMYKTSWTPTGGIVIQIAFSDLSTAITTGTSKGYDIIPMDMTVTEVFVSLLTPQTSGSIFTVDINEAGTSIISTKVTVDNGENSSLTAATPPVISDTTLTKGNLITIDVDQVGDGTAKGGIATIIGYAN